MYKDREDVQKWIELTEGFSGSGEPEKVLKVISAALKGKNAVKINIKKSLDGTIDYNIEQE